MILFRLFLVLALTSVTVLWAGDRPWHVFQVLGLSAFGSAENISYTLFYATPMMLTGTAVSIALKAGLFNIGAEGQLYMGAVFAALWAYVTRDAALPTVIVVPAAFLFSFLGGAFWGSLAGYLRTRRQTHEVIATIMLNFVALALANWVVVNPLKNPETQNIETVWVAEAYRLPKLWLQTPMSAPISFLLCAVLLWAIRSTWWGFRVRATGQNENAAKIAGIDVKQTALIAMALSGGIAGLVGFHEVFCNSYRLIDGFSSGFGFTGLAIALLAQGNIPKTVLGALLFGALQKGALDLDLETEKITRDLSAVIQALILLALSIPTLRFKKRAKA